MAKKDDVNLLELNRYRNVNERDVENVKLFLSGKNKETKLPSWAKAFKDHLSLENGNLKLGDRIVVANQEREALMRRLIYSKDSDVPPSRDAGYYLIKKRYANISRRQWLAFLKAQRVIRLTDNAPMKTKRGGKKLTRTGEIECDLFFISKDDLPPRLRKGNAALYAVFVAVDRLTSLCYTELTGDKEQKSVTPAINRAVSFFTKRLSIPAKSQVWYMDAGVEFSAKPFKSKGIERNIVAAGSKVEKKNSDLQRQFHRLKNAERMSSIEDGLKQATDLVNNSYNRVLKMTANEASEKYGTKEESRKLLDEYNKHREKADEDRRKPLNVGDMVRIVMKSQKANPFYKAYRGKQYTQDGYPVNKKNKSYFKDRQISKELYEVTAIRGRNPVKYKVDGKWYVRSGLSEPVPGMKDAHGKFIVKDGKKVYTDLKSESVIEENRKNNVQKKPKAKPKPRKKVVQPKMEPQDNATVNAFKDTAEVETELDKLLREVNRLKKRGRRLSLEKDKSLRKRIEKVIKWSETKKKFSKGFIKDTYKEYLNKAKDVMKLLSKLQIEAK